MKISRLAFIIMFLSITGSSYAQITSQPDRPWLFRAITKSQLIVVVEVLSEQPDTAQSHVNDVFANTPWSLAPPSLYTCRVLQTLKGLSQPTFQVHLPRLVSFSYGQAHLSVESGDHVLLLLQTNNTGTTSATVNSVPLIKIGKQQIVSESPITQDLQSIIVGLLLDSLDDPTLRTASAFILQGTVSPEVPARLIKYIDDPDLLTRGAVLGCFAANQQVAAIPRIAQLAKALNKQNPDAGNGDMEAMSLLKFTVPDAVPFLNPLIIDNNYEIRLFSTRALRNLPAESSVPYLVLALRDPDYQHIIPSTAWRLLHKIVPTLGSTFGIGDAFFLEHKGTEVQSIYSWWNDELLGKHIPNTPEGKKLLNYVLPDTVPVATLNTLLFHPVPTVRAEAISRLRKQANTSSIPYLVLALQDPDTTVAYQAYKILHRLVPTLGAGQSAAAFAANRDAATQPLYAWWNDELLGKHLPKPPAS